MATYRVSAELTRGSLPVAANVFHVTPQGSDPGIGLENFVEKLQTFYTAIRQIFTTDTTITLGGQTPTVGVVPTTFVPLGTTTVTGQTGTASAPDNAAAIVTWRTSVGGRSYRGRTYLGPLANITAAGDGRNIRAADVELIQNAATALVNTSIADTTYIWGVYSAKLSQLTPISAAVARPYIGSQRGRLT